MNVIRINYNKYHNKCYNKLQFACCQDKSDFYGFIIGEFFNKKSISFSLFPFLLTIIPNIYMNLISSGSI